MDFNYQALSELGNKVKGEISAESLDQAYDRLSQKGYIPFKVTKAKGMGTSDSLEGLKTKLTKVKPQELILFTKQFRTMFQAGVSVLEILRTMEQQTENLKLKKVIIKISEDVREGLSLYEAFSKHPDVFSNLYCSMIRAGEVSGSLPDVMTRLAYLLEHEHKVKSDIKSALQYPIIVLIALSIAFFVLLTFVIPKFVQIFKSAHIDLPLPTIICMNLYHFLANYWYLCIGGVVLLVLGAYYYFRTKQGKYLLHKTFLKIPIVGPVFQKAAMSRFASIFAILQASGVSVLNALDILSFTIGNAAISREFDRIRDKLKQGRGISEPLKYAKFFTPMIINMVAIGEESGNLDEMLNESSAHYDEEVSYAISQMTTNLGPVLIVGLAGIVGFFALAIFLPMWDLTKMVQ